MEKQIIKILAIDANPDHLVVLKALLSEKFPKAKYFEATTGEKGIELCLLESPDVIFLAIEMPVMDSFEICRNIKSNDATNIIPVVMITASSPEDRQSRIKALESGADAFLARPIEESELRAQIRSMILVKEAREQKQNEAERLQVLVEDKTRELTDELQRHISAQNELQDSFDKLKGSRLAVLKLSEELLVEINVRKRTEEALTQSRKEFQNYFESAAIGMSVTSPDKEWIEVNQKLCQMLGYTKEELIGIYWADISHPGELNQNLDLFQQALDGKIDTYQIDKRFIRKDGSVLYVTLSVVCERNEDGTLHHLLASYVDITERIFAEKSLKDSEERFQLLFNKAPLGYQSLDFDGKFIEINQKWLDTLGYSREEVIGKWFGDFLSPEYQDGFRQRFPVFKEKGSIHSEFKMVHKNGSHLFIAFEGKIGYGLDGEFKQTHCILQDITESRKNAEALRESENRFRSLYENAPIGIYRTTPDGKILLANPVLVKLFGRKSFKEIRQWNLSSDSDFELQYSRKEFQERIERYGRIKGLEAKVVRKDGSVVHIRESAVLVRDNFGSPLYYDGTIEDITEQKLAEEALKYSEEYNRMLFEKSVIGLLVSNMDGKLMDVNPAYANIIGRTVDEALKLTYWDITPEKYEEQEMLMIESLNTVGYYGPYEKEYIHKDGHLVPVRLQGLMIERDGKKFVWSSVEDITERKRAELRAKEHDRQIAFMVGNLPGFIYRCKNDKDWTMLYISEGCKSITGYAPEDFIENRKIPFNDIIRDEFKSEIVRKWEMAISDKTQFCHEYQIVTSSNEIKWVLERGAGIFDETNCLLFLEGYIEDVTDRKHAEETLRELSEFNNQIITNAQEGIIVYDRDQKIQVWNPYMENLTGIPAAWIFGKNPGDEFPFLNDAGVMDAIKKALNGEICVANNFPFSIQSTGKSGWASDTTGPLRNADGEITGAISLVRDISLSKQAEQALMESQHQLASIYDTVGDVIFLLAVEAVDTYRFISINPAFYNITGLSEEMIVGKLVSEVIPEPSLSMVLGKYRKAIRENSVVRWEEVTDYPSGRLVGDVSIAPVVDSCGICTHLVGSVHDITERKKAEEALRNSEEIMRYIVKHDPNALAVYDQDLHYIAASNRYLHDYDVKEEDIIGKHHYEVFPEMPHKWKEVHQRCLKGAIEGNEDDYFERPDGSITYNRWECRPWYKVDGKIGGIITYTEVTTGRKKAEIQLQEKNEQLIKLNGELITAKEKAEESDRLKSSFLANMSHEIRTPMNGILGFAALLKEPRLSGEMQNDYIEMIEKSGARMLNIINDIMSISKVEAGQMDVELSMFSVNEQIGHLIKFFKPEADKKGLKLLSQSGLPEDKAILKTDKDKLVAVLSNLVKNALKFTEKGSIEIGYQLKGEYLEFYVIDTGIGFSLEHKEIIFERFRQIGETLSRNYEGAGLGLSIAKAYVEMLGGEIRAESEPGKGSAFYFTLPYALNGKTATGNIVSTDVTESKVRNLKILIAEDDKISERLLTFTVKRFSREMLIAKNGLEAVEICRNHPDIDLVLMDIQMPQMDGHEATRQIKQFNKKAVIIAQTAYALENDRAKAIEAGCDDYVAKPIDKVFLHTLINKHFKDRVS